MTELLAVYIVICISVFARVRPDIDGRFTSEIDFHYHTIYTTNPHRFSKKFLTKGLIILTEISAVGTVLVRFKIRGK